MTAAGTDVRGHHHDLRVVEVVYDDGAALRLLECWCGATDVGTAA